MARKPNYSFERMERDRLKANKAAEKAKAKRDEREVKPESAEAPQDGGEPAADDQ